MTRAQMMQEVDAILDSLIARAIDRHDWTPREKADIRHNLKWWKQEKLDEINTELDALVRSMLH